MTTAIDRKLHQLGLLALLRRDLPTYYQALAREPDEPLRIAALVALLDLKAVWSTQADLVLANCHRGAVKRRAFPFFLSVFAYELAEQVAAIASENVDALLTARMQAEIDLDYSRMADLDVQLYLAHGAPEYLWSAEGNAERAAGWRVSVPAFVTTLLARPMDPNGPFQLLLALRNANQPTLVERACTAFEAAQLYKNESGVFRAALLLDRGDSRGALKALDKLPPNAANPILNAYNLQLRGEALGAAGAFRESYAAYQRMNRLDRVTGVDPKGFYRGVERRAAYRFEGNQDDNRCRSHMMMVGFPRSGTTLLENALGAHPGVETFEEPKALARMSRWLERFAPESLAVSLPLAGEARDKYFDELHRQSRKPDARMRIDKMPMSSAEAAFLSQIMPGMRFIFSIRHPYDVILSCFRQNFIANTAMENFRTIADAAALYDFTMSQWFSVHSLDDPAVAYVRYEDLVQSFRPTLERVLDFVGVGWDDAVLGFVEAADRRSAKTPSYKKVRSGLSIGVQSTRDSYKFLFDTKETAVLRKWVGHFGYAE